MYANGKKGNSDVVFILLDDGSIYETVYKGKAFGWDNPPRLRSQADPKDNFQSYRSLFGDALYVLSSISVYVSRDSATSWKPDTSGLPPGVFNCLALDTSQAVYLAHSNGLWKQHPDSNIWRKVSSFPSSYVTFVYADRKNRLYAGSFGQFYISTNGGSTWTQNTTGLGTRRASEHKRLLI